MQKHNFVFHNKYKTALLSVSVITDVLAGLVTWWQTQQIGQALIVANHWSFCFIHKIDMYFLLFCPSNSSARTHFGNVRCRRYFVLWNSYAEGCWQKLLELDSSYTKEIIVKCNHGNVLEWLDLQLKPEVKSTNTGNWKLHLLLLNYILLWQDIM